MKINLLIACVNNGHYTSLLERALPRWLNGADSITIVTDHRDRETADVALKFNCRLFKTGAFYEGGRIFGKANALEDARRSVPHEGWLVLTDADILPPLNWRQVMNDANMQAGCLYGCKRETDDGKPVIFEREIAGYFMAWHQDDPHDGPFDTKWSHAGGFDSVHNQRWPQSLWRWLPLTVTHLGEPFNWYGTGPEAKEKMDALLKGWKQYGHGKCPGERITNDWS